MGRLPTLTRKSGSTRSTARQGSKPWAKAQLAKGDLEHGRRQLYEMLMDRPPMAGYGQAAGTLYQWAGRKFAGEDLRENIYWEDIEPTPAFSAETHWATPAEPARIRSLEIWRRGEQRQAAVF